MLIRRESVPLSRFSFEIVPRGPRAHLDWLGGIALEWVGQARRDPLATAAERLGRTSPGASHANTNWVTARPPRGRLGRSRAHGRELMSLRLSAEGVCLARG
jgi:hypothetical protein